MLKMRLSDKLIKKTPYQIVAEEFGVSPKFVGMIARGERKGIRGVGLSVKKRLEELVSEKPVKRELENSVA